MWEDDFSLFDDEALKNWRRKKNVYLAQTQYQ